MIGSVSVRSYAFGICCALASILWLAPAAQAESVNVKYRGQVDLAPFFCQDVARSSFIERVCYDEVQSYMLISLNGTYYHYCRIDGGTVTDLLNAESMGRYYNAFIKGRFDCRMGGVPSY